MKKHIYKIVMLITLASFVLSSCSVQYRERHRGGREQHGDHHRDNDHHYNRN